jgi:hypothetical protein
VTNLLHQRTSAIGYLLTQGLATVVWWLGLVTWPRFQELFVAPGGWPAARTVLVADLVLFGGGSAVVGLLALAGHRLAPSAGLALIGVASYATAVSLAWVAPPVDRWLGPLVMVVALTATVLAVLVVARATPSQLDDGARR